MLEGPQEAPDESLAPLLAAIAEDVQRSTGMARAGIMGSYAARMNYARKQMKGGELAGILRALKAERDAALQTLGEKAATELKGRLAAARITARRARASGPGKG